MRTKIKKKVHPAHKKPKKSAVAKEKEPSLAMKLMNMDLMPKAKRQSLFKKHKARDVKAEISELKQASKKLKKKNVADRVEKKRIAKKIKELKALVRRSGEEQSEESESE